MLDFLTHLVLAHQRLGLYRNRLRREINLHIYEYPGKSFSLPEEEWGDFFLSIEKRIDALISGFEYRGFSFLTYLNRTLHWQMYSYRRNSRKGQYHDWILERESILNFQDETVSCAEGLCLKDKILCLSSGIGLTDRRRGVLRSRLFILLLKNIIFLDEQEFLECGELLGYSRAEGARIRIFLMARVQQRMDKRNLLVERRNNCYHKVTYYEKKLKEDNENSQDSFLCERIDKFRKRKKRINDQIIRIILLPTNREISLALGAPKGSIDSGLFYLRVYLETLSENRDNPILLDA